MDNSVMVVESNGNFWLYRYNRLLASCPTVEALKAASRLLGLEAAVNLALE